MNKDSVSNIKTSSWLNECSIYTPDDAPEVCVYYTSDTYDGIEVHDIRVNDEEVSEYIYNFLTLRDWEAEIEKKSTELANDEKAYSML